jgi:hypothetical protein
MRVPDKGYFGRHLIKVIMRVPDEGYYEST